MHPADDSVSLWISWCGQSSPLVFKLEERQGRTIFTDLIWIIWICYDMQTASCSYTLTPHQTYRVLEEHTGLESIQQSHALNKLALTMCTGNYAVLNLVSSKLLQNWVNSCLRPHTPNAWSSLVHTHTLAASTATYPCRQLAWFFEWKTSDTGHWTPSNKAP